MTNSSRKLKLVSNNCLDNVLKARGKKHKQPDLLFRILIKTINIREKSQKKVEGVYYKKIFITRQPNVIESRNWYQMIAMVLLYNHRIRFMKN